MRKLKEYTDSATNWGWGSANRPQLLDRTRHVYQYLKRAEAAGVAWPLPDGWDDRQLEAALFGGTPRCAYEPHKPQPDFAQLHEELQRHPHLTLHLAWEEYRQAQPDGYAYSRFCELYQRWRRQLDVVLRQEHVAGEKLFVDYAGATIPLPRSPRRAGAAGGDLRRRPRGQQLHLRRGHRKSGTGELDRFAHPRL